MTIYSKEQINAWARDTYYRNSARVARRRAKHYYQNKDYHHSYALMYRAKRAGAKIVELISRKGILDRDGWVCHVCRKPIEPDNASVDHVVPLNQGGNHTEDNVKAAHRTCNNRRPKGARQRDDGVMAAAPEASHRCSSLCVLVPSI